MLESTFIKEILNADDDSNIINEPSQEYPSVPTPESKGKIKGYKSRYSKLQFLIEDDHSLSPSLDGMSKSDSTIGGSQRYFGESARQLFNQRCQLISRQRHIVAKSKSEDLTATFFADKHADDDTIAGMDRRKVGKRHYRKKFTGQLKDDLSVGTTFSLTSEIDSNASSPTRMLEPIRLELRQATSAGTTKRFTSIICLSIFLSSFYEL